MAKGSGLTLDWPGKFDADGQRASPPRPPDVAPLQVIERWRPTSRGAGDSPGGVPTSSPASAGESASLLVLGDNLHALAALSARLAGTLHLAVMDPPFATGTRFVARRPLGDDATPRLEVPAFDDAWPGGIPGFIRMMDPRLQALIALLRDDASLYVHVDPIASAPLRLVLDELLGDDALMREIVWRIGWISGFKSRARNWIRNHDTILFYVRDRARFTFHRRVVPHVEGYRRRGGPRPTSDAPPTTTGIPIDDVWNASPEEHALAGDASLDSIQIKSLSREKTGWATQKPEALLARIIEASSREGDWCVDPFVGAGTSVVAAARLGRRFVGIDASPLAIALTRARLDRLGVAYDVARIGPAPSSAPLALEVRARVVEGALRSSLAEVHASDAPDDAGLPEVWHAASARDRLEAWAVGPCAEDGVFEPIALARRGSEGGRALSLELVTPLPPGTSLACPRRWIVRGWDALGRWVDADLDVSCA